MNEFDIEDDDDDIYSYRKQPSNRYGVKISNPNGSINRENRYQSKVLSSTELYSDDDDLEVEELPEGQLVKNVRSMNTKSELIDDSLLDEINLDDITEAYQAVVVKGCDGVNKM